MESPCRAVLAGCVGRVLWICVSGGVAAPARIAPNLRGVGGLRGRMCRAALAGVPSACAVIIVADADVLHFPMVDDDDGSGPIPCPVVSRHDMQHF